MPTLVRMTQPTNSCQDFARRRATCDNFPASGLSSIFTFQVLTSDWDEASRPSAPPHVPSRNSKCSAAARAPSPDVGKPVFSIVGLVATMFWFGSPTLSNITPEHETGDVLAAPRALKARSTDCAGCNSPWCLKAQRKPNCEGLGVAAAASQRGSTQILAKFARISCTALASSRAVMSVSNRHRLPLHLPMPGRSILR